MKDTSEYLNIFASEAASWFKKSTFVAENHAFFKEFFKRENLEKAVWADFQKIGEHLHCFKTMPIAGANALGKPNHPIEHYRTSFIYLAHGPEAPAERIRGFCTDARYQLKYFGKSAVSELAAYLFPDHFIFTNARDLFAVDFLKIAVEKHDGDVVSELEAFSKATKPVAELYLKIVGKQTGLPLNLELDQFFSWLYETYSDDKHTVKPPPPSEGVAYWWLNTNPNIWNFMDLPIGEKRTYTSRSDKGKKRRNYQCFLQAKPGDVAIGYVTSPKKEVVAICKITKGLHKTEKGEEIEFEKIEQLKDPITYKTMRANPALVESEPFTSKHQGSLFRLTKQEYEIIRSLISGTEPPPNHKPYDKSTAMAGLFLDKSQFDEMLDALKEKKNVILQGAPGVGKTYVAKRLAHALTESYDPMQVEMIQFHQSYSYEDFIQGFRPTAEGTFRLKRGIFYQFCLRARNDEAKGKHYVFIIDEINRGNLSKIFGELMMLIEPDKRGKEHAIPLTYSENADEKFYIPKNLHLIGLMNTADRSLAMVDYALRRRFRFITLKPEFSSDAFHGFLTGAKAKPALVKIIQTRMNDLNKIIAEDKNLGSGFQIGHSYFCPGNGFEANDAWYGRVIKLEIVPLIQEYWSDDTEKVKKHEDALLDGVGM